MERYEVLRDIGSGNFGVAKLVRDVWTKELYAVKLIERGQKIDEHVQREIMNHRSLRHPNIVRFKEVFIAIPIKWTFFRVMLRWHFEHLSLALPCMPHEDYMSRLMYFTPIRCIISVYSDDIADPGYHQVSVNYWIQYFNKRSTCSMCIIKDFLMMFSSWRTWWGSIVKVGVVNLCYDSPLLLQKEHKIIRGYERTNDFCRNQNNFQLTIMRTSITET